MEIPVEWKRAPERPRASAEREAVSREAQLQIWHQLSHSGNVEYRFPASVSRRDDSFAFLHRIDAVDGGNRNFLFCSARPVNLHLVYFCSRSQAEVQTLIGTPSLPSPAEKVPPLPRPSSRTH